jgi:hypothetical protein
LDYHRKPDRINKIHKVEKRGKISAKTGEFETSLKS